MKRPLCVCGCRRPGVHRHHVFLEQRLPARARRDGRNLVWLSFDCHGAHHGGGPGRLPLTALPDAVFEFAAEIVGPSAFDYFRRRYRGDDPRLAALLDLPVPERAPVGRRLRP